MIAAKLKGIVSDNHRLELDVPSSIPPGEVEVIILRSETKQGKKRRASKSNANSHPAAGIWADRDDIDDTVEFVSKLRRDMESRGNAPQSFQGGYIA